MENTAAPTPTETRDAEYATLDDAGRVQYVEAIRNRATHDEAMAVARNAR